MTAVRSLILIAGLLTALGIAPAEAQLVRYFEADRSGAGKAAVRLAREALDTYCLRRERIPTPTALPFLLCRRSAVFVSTMDRNGAPRCCMGSLYPRGASLAADLIDTATRAAAHDLRFPPLQPKELAGLRVIVSILDPPEPVSDPWRLDPVVDGLAVRGTLRTGVVLPGETARRDRFVQWGRRRAAATDTDYVQYLRLKAVRFMEAPKEAPHDSS